MYSSVFFKKCFYAAVFCFCTLLITAIPYSCEARSILSFMKQDSGPTIKGFHIGDSYTELCARTGVKWYRILTEIPCVSTLVDSNIDYSNHHFYHNFNQSIIVALDSKNKVDYIEIKEEALKTLFNAHQLDKNFLKAFIEAYNIPRLDMKHLVSFIVDCNVAVYSTENWAIEFNMVEMNLGDMKESTIASMQLFRIMPEHYDFN